MKGMFSEYQKKINGFAPKYVWGVDSTGEVYESKIGSDGYHGYRLEEEDNMRKTILDEWEKR